MNYDALLRPRSVALVGASTTADSVGEVMVRHAARGGLLGESLWAVNPRYDDIHGVECFASLDALPAVPDHVVIALGDARVEAALADAIRVGARAATVYGPLALDDGALRARVRDQALAADIAMLGGNAMGCYSFHHGFWNCGFATRETHRPGGTVLITQSGSVFYSLVDADERIDFHTVVGPGQELIVNAVDVLHDALNQPGVTSIALFLESVRDPTGLVTAFARAAELDIPIAVCKVGRTERSNQLAVSHSGALAGNDAAFSAVCERYGARRVGSIDELFATTVLFERCRPLGRGGVVAVSDSGGERGLLIDLADEFDVPFADLAPTTTARLVELLDEGVPPVNPLDAWSSGANWSEVYGGSLTAMLADPAAAIGVVVADRGPGSTVLADNADAARVAHAATGKPVVLLSNHQGSGTDPLAVELTREGTPVLDGLPVTLRALRHLLAQRDHRAPRSIDKVAPIAVDGPAIATEFGALQFLAANGIPVVGAISVGSRAEVIAAAATIGGSVVVKTATPGIAHKSDVGGVIVNCATPSEAAAAYDDLATRLGPRALVAPMIDTANAVEMLIGMTTDDQWGPLVTFGFGGVHAEVLRDIAVLVAPFDAVFARAALDRLRLRPLLDGVRGAPPVNIDALCAVAARFSELVVAIADTVREIDVNPLLATPDGVIALDALFVTSERS